MRPGVFECGAVLCRLAALYWPCGCGLGVVSFGPRRACVSVSVCSAHCHCCGPAESPSRVPVVLAELSLFDEDKGRFRPHLTFFEHYALNKTFNLSLLVAVGEQ